MKLTIIAEIPLIIYIEPNAYTSDGTAMNVAP